MRFYPFLVHSFTLCCHLQVRGFCIVYRGRSHLDLCPTVDNIDWKEWILVTKSLTTSCRRLETPGECLSLSHPICPVFSCNIVAYCLPFLVGGGANLCVSRDFVCILTSFAFLRHSPFHLDLYGGVSDDWQVYAVSLVRDVLSTIYPSPLWLHCFRLAAMNLPVFYTPHCLAG